MQYNPNVPMTVSEWMVYAILPTIVSCEFCQYLLWRWVRTFSEVWFFFVGLTCFLIMQLPSLFFSSLLVNGAHFTSYNHGDSCLLFLICLQGTPHSILWLSVNVLTFIWWIWPHSPSIHLTFTPRSPEDATTHPTCLMWAAELDVLRDWILVLLWFICFLVYLVKPPFYCFERKCVTWFWILYFIWING